MNLLESRINLKQFTYRLLVDNYYRNTLTARSLCSARCAKIDSANNSRKMRLWKCSAVHAAKYRSGILLRKVSNLGAYMAPSGPGTKTGFSGQTRNWTGRDHSQAILSAYRHERACRPP